MKSTSSAGRFFAILITSASLSLALMPLSLAFDALLLPLVTIGATVFTVLMVARDYAPRASYRRDLAAATVNFPACAERLPLAA